MSLLHMETDLVRGAGNQLQQTSASLQQQTQQLDNLVQALANAWQGQSATIFVGEIRPVLQQLYQFAGMSERLNQRLQHEVDEWERIGTALLGGTSVAMASLPATGGGNILGAQTTAFAEQYQNLTWSEKFNELEQLEQKIAALEKELDGQPPVDEGRIEEIDAEIARLKAEMDEAQEDADTWYNKVIPTFPLQGDDDGVPWRVRTDNYEDTIADYEQQLQALQEEKDALIIVQDKQDELAELKGQQNTLQTIITDGIAADGPSSKHRYFPGTIISNCTKYASARRYFPDAVNGNAYVWDDQAAAAGYEVGDVPVKGSIMVFEPGVKGSHAQYGHVAFVEKVEPMPNGEYKVTFSDNHHPDPELCKEYGVPDQKADWPNYHMIKPGEAGISFIYDQKPMM